MVKSGKGRRELGRVVGGFGDEGFGSVFVDSPSAEDGLGRLFDGHNGNNRHIDGFAVRGLLLSHHHVEKQVFVVF